MAERAAHTQEELMVWFQIREYRDSDYAIVREVYSTGFREHVGAVRFLLLQQCWAQTLLLGIFLLLLFTTGSVLASLLAVSGVLTLGWVAVRCLFEQGIKLGLSEDLWDIGASYMGAGSVSCFWVAVSGGSVVGTVGILPCVEEPGTWELKRISVRREFRGRGLAKALCQTALRFVANHKVKRVVLFTSMVQSDAHKLYHRLGFQREEEFVWPSLPARLINFLVFKYAYKFDSDG